MDFKESGIEVQGKKREDALGSSSAEMRNCKEKPDGAVHGIHGDEGWGLSASYLQSWERANYVWPMYQWACDMNLREG